MDMGKRPATYTDLEELPPNRVGEIIASSAEDASSRAEPFDALELTPGILWGR